MFQLSPEEFANLMSQFATLSWGGKRKLSPEERMEVVERILDGMDQPDAALDALWAKEAEDRLAAYRRGEIKDVALSDVLAKHQAGYLPGGKVERCLGEVKKF